MAADYIEDTDRAAPDPESRGLKFVLRALRYRNYRLYFGGQGISLVGTWMQQVALGWLVYRLTHSAMLLGVVGFFSQIPHLFISPFAGVLADRWNRHRIRQAAAPGLRLRGRQRGGDDRPPSIRYLHRLADRHRRLG